MTVKAFVFKSFPNTICVPLTNSTMNKKLFKFYALQSRLQYEVWSLKKIYNIQECEVEEIENGFLNFKFKALRGSNNEEFSLSFVDLP